MKISGKVGQPTSTPRTARALFYLEFICYYLEQKSFLSSRHAKTTDLINVILVTGKFAINGVTNEGDALLHYVKEGSNPTIKFPHIIQNGVDLALLAMTESPMIMAARNKHHIIAMNCITI